MPIHNRADFWLWQFAYDFLNYFCWRLFARNLTCLSQQIKLFSHLGILRRYAIQFLRDRVVLRFSCALLQVSVSHLTRRLPSASNGKH